MCAFEKGTVQLTEPSWSIEQFIWLYETALYFGVRPLSISSPILPTLTAGGPQSLMQESYPALFLEISLIGEAKD